jgi:hypothetical protein
MNSSVITVSEPISDGGASNFIFSSDERSVINGLVAPVFVPLLTSSETVSLEEDSNETVFVLKGTNLFPCGIELNLFRGSLNNQIQGRVPIDVVNETTINISLLNDIFAREEEYLFTLSYGPGMTLQTSAIIGFDNTPEYDFFLFFF